jgi:hypothetical protein
VDDARRDFPGDEMMVELYVVRAIRQLHGQSFPANIHVQRTVYPDIFFFGYGTDGEKDIILQINVRHRVDHSVDFFPRLDFAG